MVKKKKEKLEAVDGLGPKELKQIHKAIRQVWSWSRAHRLAKARCLGKDGFHRCEQCKKKVPKVFVDHISPVGEVGGPGYIQRLFIPSSGLQCLCKKCHDAKTKAERESKKTIVEMLRDAAADSKPSNGPFNGPVRNLNKSKVAKFKMTLVRVNKKAIKDFF